MFPDIFRDDVFRLETKRLWLRWPTAADEAAIERLAGARAVAEMTAHVPHPYPKDAAAAFIYQARVGNAQGAALTFAIAPLSRPAEAIGMIGLHGEGDTAMLGYWLGQPFHGRGLMSEAVRALVDAAYALTGYACVETYVRLDNPASARVLEKCGFSRAAEMLMHFPARRSDFRCALYRCRRPDGVVRDARMRDLRAMPRRAASGPALRAAAPA